MNIILFLKSTRPILKMAVFFVILCFMQSCANIVPPDGGPIDETVPVLITERPADSSLNKKVSKIELRFDKYMEIQDLENNFQISPLIRIKPTVISYGKRIEIKIEDSLLKENTTYKLSLGNAIVDNREHTPYADYNYIFSTGSYFDSLSLSGKVFDAETGFPDSTATIFLYAETVSDSNILREKPTYIQQVDQSGYFKFSLLPAQKFKVFAVEDKNNNQTYDFLEEKMDFLDQIAIPTFENDSFYLFHIFKEEIDSTKLIPEEVTNMDSTRQIDSTELALEDEDKAGISRRSQRAKSKSAIPFRVLVDTFNVEARTMEINKDLKIEIHTELSEIDSGKIYLSYDDNGIEVEAIQTLEVDSQSISIKTKWLEDKIYTLRLVKGWAKDTADAELTPGKYIFRTKRNDDYGKLEINIDSSYVGNKHVLFVFKGEDSVYQNVILQEKVIIPLLEPGNYNMRIFIDENENEKWDSGSLFPRKHAEKVIPFPNQIVLKSGWENEIDFKKQIDPKEKALIELKAKEEIELSDESQAEESFDEELNDERE